MDTSNPPARRGHLIQHAKQTLAPLQAWWDQYGIASEQDSHLSYFYKRIGSIVQEATTSLDRLATQHPRYLTEKKLKGLERRFDTLPESWMWLLREAHLFETLRAQVKPTSREVQALVAELIETAHHIKHAYRDMQEARPHAARIDTLEPMLKEAGVAADLAKNVIKRSQEIREDNYRAQWRDLAPPPLTPAHRFSIEHDRLYLKFLEAHTYHLKTRFFAVHTPMAALTARIAGDLPEWRGILNCWRTPP
jgi:hypothetical protein